MARIKRLVPKRVTTFSLPVEILEALNNYHNESGIDKCIIVEHALKVFFESGAEIVTSVQSNKKDGYY